MLPSVLTKGSHHQTVGLDSWVSTAVVMMQADDSLSSFPNVQARLDMVTPNRDGPSKFYSKIKMDEAGTRSVFLLYLTQQGLSPRTAALKAASDQSSIRPSVRNETS